MTQTSYKIAFRIPNINSLACRLILNYKISTQNFNRAIYNVIEKLSSTPNSVKNTGGRRFLSLQGNSWLRLVLSWTKEALFKEVCLKAFVSQLESLFGKFLTKFVYNSFKKIIFTLLGRNFAFNLEY